MKKISFLLLTSALVSLPAVAQAGEWYIGAGGGVQIPRDSEINTNINQDVEYDLGWGALGTVGYRYGNGLRSELEFSYRDAGVDQISLSAIDDGSTNSYSLMANTLYDINTGMGLLPYLGAGIGVTQINYNDVRTIGGSVLDDSDISPAVQGIAGVSVSLTPSLDFFTQYQYQYIFDVKPSTNAGSKVDADYGNSLITAGLRWNFGAPSAPVVTPPKPKAEPVVDLPQTLPEAKVEEPAPVPAAPPIEQYMVFFDFNRSDLTIEAADIIKKVAENAQAGKITQLDVTGYADRVGSDRYNMKLSRKRAEAVKRQLIRLGLPENEIVTAAKGENDPLVPTKDGVREAQNRRVEIIYGK